MHFEAQGKDPEPRHCGYAWLGVQGHHIDDLAEYARNGKGNMDSKSGSEGTM